MTRERPYFLILPPHELWRPWIGHPPGDDEDRELPYRILAARGARFRRIDIHRAPWNPWARQPPMLRAIDPLRALRVLLRERDAAMVFCHFESSALLILLLRRLLRFRGKVVIYDVGVGGGRLRQLILRLSVPRADALLVAGRNQVAPLQAAWHPAGLVQWCPLATDVAFFHASPDRPLGPVLAIGDDGTRDYPTLLEAARGLKVDVLIRTRQLDPAQVVAPVRVMSDFLSMSAYRDMLGAARIVVLPLHPSAYAGGVSVLLQAMAMARPLVVSASPGLADYLRDGETCLLVPCGQPAALRAAIDRLLADPALRLRLGQAARAAAVAEHSLERQADRLAALVTRLTGWVPGPPP